MAKRLVGEISHYYSKIGVAVLDLKDDLTMGDRISIEGPSTNLKMTVDSMQLEHEAVKVARKGGSVGLKVSDKVRPGDNVYFEE